MGIGVGLIFLAREGLSVAMLKVMPDASQAETPADDTPQVAATVETDAERPRARMSG